jgi:outer membrane protein TolC
MHTRSRAIVNRWTGRVLAVNLLLLGAGLGVPAAAFTLKLAASALLPSVSASVAATAEPKAAVPEPALPAAPR